MHQIINFIFNLKNNLKLIINGSMNGNKFKELQLEVTGFVPPIKDKLKYGTGLEINYILLLLIENS
jgi:hypothetical protein